jgi:hypothetical protein
MTGKEIKEEWLNQNTIAQESGKTENEIKVEELRAQEQAEKDATDPNDQKKLDEIYNRYDKLITPLLEEMKAKNVPEKIESIDKTKGYISNLADDNYIFTHVTTEDNARSITEGGMSISLGTGISSTLTQLGSEGANSQIERLANGEVVHRDKNNNSVAIIAVPKSELDVMQGTSIAEKFENWLVENNKINDKGQLAIPVEFNAGYLSGQNFITNNQKTKELWQTHQQRFANNVVFAKTTMYNFYTTRATDLLQKAIQDHDL